MNRWIKWSFGGTEMMQGKQLWLSEEISTRPYPTAFSQPPLGYSPSSTNLLIEKNYQYESGSFLITESEKEVYILKEADFPEVWFQGPEYSLHF